mmetsp:Transcript_11985/g.21211  ORF Transcript_11985/g.21211 Transcript_11985/m.21211 type:complete len:937 (+) Transcript_11985:67-2877(+)
MAPRPAQDRSRSSSKPGSLAPKDAAGRSSYRGSSRPGSARGVERTREAPTPQQPRRAPGSLRKSTPPKVKAKAQCKAPVVDSKDLELANFQRPTRTAAEASAAARTLQRWWRSLCRHPSLEVLCSGAREFSPVPASVLAAMSPPGPEEEVPAPESMETVSGPPWCRSEPTTSTPPKHACVAKRPVRDGLTEDGLTEELEARPAEVTGGPELPNNSCFFVQSAATPQQRRPYCPSIYASPEESSLQPVSRSAPEESVQPLPSPGATAERVAQMRARIKSLQELRGSQVEAAQVEAPSSSQPSIPKPPTRPPPLRQPSPPPPAPKPEARLASIMSFLDEVEETSRADMSSLVSSARSSRAPQPGFDSARDIPPFESERLWPPSGLTQDAAALSSRASLLEVEVRDKKQIIESLKRALAETKEHEKRAVESVDKDWEDKQQKQKAHYEAGLERHLRLVDRLLNDKTELTKRCELFAEELKAVERKFQMKVEELDEQASKVLSKNKQNWIATERLKREAWEKEKVKEIKEMTIKGLQPEVERILADKKQDKIKMEERHREALEEQRRELMELAQQQVREVREQKLRDQEEALDRERENHRRKMRDEFDRFQRELQEERSKCAADLLAERRQREEMLRQGVEGTEARLREVLEAQRAKSEAALQEARSAAAEAERQHRLELSNLEERLRAEGEQARRLLEEQARLDLEKREASLRQELSAERDRQLEVLMERLSREHVEQQQALKQETGAKVEEARAQAGEEVGRLARLLEEAKSEASAAISEKSHLEQNLQTLKDCRAADAARTGDLERRCKDLESDRAELRERAEKDLEQHRNELWKLSEMREKELDDIRKDLGAATAQVAEEQAKLEKQRLEAQQREEQIIGELEARVKRTLQAKDDTIAELRTRCAGLENKVREFEYLLERQREELLGGLTKREDHR